jgi:hypothetical protein
LSQLAHFQVEIVRVGDVIEEASYCNSHQHSRSCRVLKLGLFRDRKNSGDNLLPVIATITPVPIDFLASISGGRPVTQDASELLPVFRTKFVGLQTARACASDLSNGGEYLLLYCFIVFRMFRKRGILCPSVVSGERAERGWRTYWTMLWRFERLSIGESCELPLSCIMSW